MLTLPTTSTNRDYSFIGRSCESNCNIKLFVFGNVVTQGKTICKFVHNLILLQVMHRYILSRIHISC